MSVRVQLQSFRVGNVLVLCVRVFSVEPPSPAPDANYSNGWEAVKVKPGRAGVPSDPIWPEKNLKVWAPSPVAAPGLAFERRTAKRA